MVSRSFCHLSRSAEVVLETSCSRSDATCTVKENCSNTNLPLGELPPPSKIFAFTFVRDPLERALAGYAEVDAVHRHKDPKASKNQIAAGTTYIHVPRHNNTHGVDRFLAYLDDLANGRLPPAWKPGHSCPESNPLQNPEHAARYDFFGRLESLSEDWKLMQQLAGVPLQERTTASEVPFDHQGKDADYLEDEATKRTDEVVHKVCELYAADYACFGYELPTPCQSLEELERLHWPIA